MKQRSIRIIADYLAHRPIGRIVTVLPVGQGNYLVAVEDRRDGREHVLFTPEDLEAWLGSFAEGRCLIPTKGFCDCCGELHRDRDVDGELFELCTKCQAGLTGAGFEKAA